jgi:uncharacterized protein
MKPNLRRCISCRQVAPKQEFWRVVRLYPTQEIQLDQGMGRSAYLCRNAHCLFMAQKKTDSVVLLKQKFPQKFINN